VLGEYIPTARNGGVADLWERLGFRRAGALWERDVAAGRPPGRQEDFIRRLNEIETVVQNMKVPASFANLFYSLREHIDYVRARLDARSYPPGR